MSDRRILPVLEPSGAVPSLVTAMTAPEFYPHRPDTVEVRETHISWVFLCGDRVFKLKKPVCFAFVDYSTLDRRRLYCHEEVRLNRRLADPIYLAVRSVVRQGDGFVLAEDGVPGAVDFVVEMKRLPEESSLEQRIAAGVATRADVDRIVDTLVDFYAACAAQLDPRRGGARAVEAIVGANWREIRELAGDTIPARHLDEIEREAQSFVERHRRLLDERARSGKVREGHGDLRAEHVSIGSEIFIFDCVEFSEELRTGDVASEIAFLAMDLDRLGRPDLGEHLRTRFADLTNDREIETLLPFYQAHRAGVRGKVESLKAREGRSSEAERTSARRRARRYFRLALRHARALPPASVLVVCGLSATGKSTVAGQLADLTGFHVSSSDLVRKEIAARFAVEPAGLYTNEMTEHTYSALAEQARKALHLGRGIILDGTFRTRAHRTLVIEATAAASVPVRFVECRAPQHEIARRFEARARLPHHPSDATWDVYLDQRGRFEPLTEITPRSHVVLDTTKEEMEVTVALGELLEDVRKDAEAVG